MRSVRIFIAILMAFSLAFPVVPAQAKQGCPMVASMQSHGGSSMMMAKQDCPGCKKMHQQQNSGKRSGCCDGMGCGSHCPPMTGGISLLLPAAASEPLALTAQVIRFSVHADTPVPGIPDNQDRPPKTLS